MRSRAATPPAAPASRRRPIRAHLTDGNVSPYPDADRLARVEAMLEQLQQTLETQFERIAQLQAQLDRAIADRPLSPRR